jgi:tRNA 2-thiouridine synthesizing protein B
LILHVFNQPITALPAVISAGDAILLIENAVYGQLNGDNCRPDVKLFALEADLKARGVTAQSDLMVIDYAGFVSLCTEYDKVVSW